MTDEYLKFVYAKEILTKKKKHQMCKLRLDCRL